MSAVCLLHDGVDEEGHGPDAGGNGGRSRDDYALSSLFAESLPQDDPAEVDRAIHLQVALQPASGASTPIRTGPPALSILETREPRTYTADERALSAFLSQQLHDLLCGRIDALPLMRKYHRDPRRLGIPRWVDAREDRSVRLAVAEAMLGRVLLFIHAGSPGGPISQWHVDSNLIERQSFSTAYPHIIVEREDRYHAGTREPLETEWTIRRIQNQQAETRVNRALDLANLGLDILKIIL